MASCGRHPLSRLKPLGLKSSRRLRPSEKLNERLGRFGRFARCIDPSGKNGRACQFTGQRTDQLRTGDWHDFRGLCNSKFRVASGYNLCSLGTRDQYRFPLHLLGDAETIKDAGEINAACASLRGIGIDDRSGGKERVLESVNRADIWPRPARVPPRKPGCRPRSRGCWPPTCFASEGRPSSAVSE